MSGGAAGAVLVVEDEVYVQRLLLDVLNLDGFETEAVPSGQAALARLAAHQAPRERYRAIVLDMMLPDCAGLDVLQYLRDHRLRIPVVAISASRQLLSEAVLAGVDVALAKPFEVDQILSVVGAYCPRRAAGADAR